MTHAVLAALRSGDLTDEVFDRMYPDDVRRRSALHWTPVAVALRAVVLLAPERGMRILDVGCGPGKLCCVGAVVQPGRWHGVESDPRLAGLAVATAAALGADATFTAGDMATVDWAGFEALYFFNPFAGQLLGVGPPAAPARWAGLRDQIARTQRGLAELAVGTRVVTYQGFGGELPAGYALAHTEAIGDGQLALWVKHAGGPARSPSWTVQF